MTTSCPVCLAPQDAGLLCHSCTTKLEEALRAVPGLVFELATTVSKQARIGTGGGAGLARERNPVHWGAVEAGDVLGNVITTWCRDVSHETWMGYSLGTPAASRYLLAQVDTIRRHPAVDDLVEEITDAITQARRAIDRPGERQFMGTCMAELPDDEGRLVTCVAEVWARENATHCVCRACGISHDVGERRAWLLDQAADMLVTAKEASRYIGSVGKIDVTEASIRGLLHRKRLGYRTGTAFRLGDLLDVLTDKKAKEAA